MTKTNDGRERDQRRQQAAREPTGRVADDSDSLDHRPGRDLAERDGTEELRAGHPVIRDHRIVLHQRDDHEAAAVGERADLERDPGDRAQPGAGHHGHRQQRNSSQPLASGPGQVRTPGCHLDQAAGQQDHDEERTEQGGRSSAGQQVGQPSRPGGPLLTGPFPAGREQADGGLDGHGGHRRSRAGRCAEHPGRQVASQEQGRQAQDDDQARHDETGAAQQCPGQPAQPPGTEDGQLGGGRAGEQVGGGDPVLEFVRRQPGTVIDAELAQQGDVRGRAAKADDPDAGPLARDSDQADLPGGLHGHVLTGAGAAGLPGARAVRITGLTVLGDGAGLDRAWRVVRHTGLSRGRIRYGRRQSFSAAKGVPA